jgi:hypothetical protein
MPKNSHKSSSPKYISVPTAPIISFDVIPAHGSFAGTVQIELAARVLHRVDDGQLEAHLLEVGRLRCSPHAAKLLKEALEVLLSKIDYSQSYPVPAAAKPANGAPTASIAT